MKKLNIAVIVLFFTLLIVPLIAFEWQDGVASEIDNRMLTDNPFKQDMGFEETINQISPYVKDRIGFRNEMIEAYTQLNDKLFGELVHPSYIYGKDGYIFFKSAGGGAVWSDYYEQFAAMVYEIQNYCEERGVPFVFVFNPAKTTVLSDKLADGINYNNEWVDMFFAKLDEYGVRYINNTDMLREKTESGEAVFNQKYNAGHWNDLGAYYGMNAVLSELQKDFPALHVNTPEDFSVTQKLNTTLMVSEFPIEEYEPIYTARDEAQDITDTLCGELELDSQYKTFAYRVNHAQKENNAPRALVFQGSYVNGMGYKFLANSFGEYIAVHDYQNVTNFAYYYNIFKPDCVVFEVAEYAFSNTYFEYDRMKNMELNPTISDFESSVKTEKGIEDLSVNIGKGQALTVIELSGLPENTSYAYITMNGITYDLIPQGDGVYSLSVRNGDYTDSMEVAAACEGASLVVYR